MAILNHDGCIFEIVEQPPLGFEIWNIGKNMADGYVPFCRLAAYQPFPGGRNIEPDTLKAVRCEGAQVILAAVSAGCKTVDAMQSFIKTHRNAKPGTCAYNEVQRYKKALPYMKKLFNTK